MKHEAFNDEFNKMFKWFSNESNPGKLRLEADFNKKLLNFFLLGDSYYFILNHNTLSIEFISKEVEAIMGYLPSDFSIEFMNDRIHPDDQPWFLTFGHRMIDFFPLYR